MEQNFLVNFVNSAGVNELKRKLDIHWEKVP